MTGATPPVRATGTDAAIELSALTADERRVTLASRHEEHRVAARIDGEGD